MYFDAWEDQACIEAFVETHSKLFEEWCDQRGAVPSETHYADFCEAYAWKFVEFASKYEEDAYEGRYEYTGTDD